MLKPTAQQREQIEDFFHVITDRYEDILLHPIIDEKTGVERLAVCVADREDRNIYMLGIWFLPNDPLYKRFSFKEIDKSILLRKPPGLLGRFVWRIKNIVRHMWT